MRYSPSGELALMRLYPLLLTSVLLDHLTGSWLTGPPLGRCLRRLIQKSRWAGCYRKMSISRAAFREGASLSRTTFRERAVFSNSFRGGDLPLTEILGLAFTIVILDS